MRRRRSTMLLLGAIFALLAFFVLYIGLTRAQPPPPTATPTPEPKTQVIIAKQDIPSYTLVKEEDLTTSEINASLVTTDTVMNANTVIGQVLKRPYKANQQISASDVSEPGISLVLTKGQRGLTLPIQETDNFGGQLNDNDVVDILWSRNFEVVQAIIGADGKPVEHIAELPTTKKLLDNIKVIRVIHLIVGPKNAESTGPVQAPQTESSADQAQSQQQQTQANQSLYAKDAPPSAVLVLAVTDQQAEVIKFARENGIVSLTLRAKDDTDVERTTGITDKIMNEDYGVVLPEVLIK